MIGGLEQLNAAVRAGDATGARTIARSIEDQDALFAHLARSAGAGSALATELLVEELDATGVVHRFVRGTLLDEAAIDDVAQDALISVVASVGSYAGQSKFTTWVHRIVRNRVVDHLRRQRATSPLPAEDLGLAARMSSMIATRATVRAALEALPDLYREPVTLRDLGGLSYTEIAERTGGSLAAVKSQISRGRALVAAAIGDQAETDQE